jgi:hypothetical protein
MRGARGNAIWKNGQLARTSQFWQSKQLLAMTALIKKPLAARLSLEGEDFAAT